MAANESVSNNREGMATGLEMAAAMCRERKSRAFAESAPMGVVTALERFADDLEQLSKTLRASVAP